jgi:hypothetical protein
MEACSLHLLDLDVVARYVRVLTGAGDAVELGIADRVWGNRLLVSARQGYARAREGNEAGANAVSYGLAQLLATSGPTFAMQGVAPTTIEARVDRGVGMLLRPPSRLFIEAGLDVAAARAMPIRLDLSRGLMGGAFVPARLIPDLETLLDRRLERFLRRFADAELDGVAAVGLLLGACAAARARGVGLLEALDVVTIEAPESYPPGAVVVSGDRRRLDPALRKRLEAAAKPPKQPSLVARLFGRGRSDPTAGGSGPA